MPVSKKKNGSRIYDLGYRFMLWSSLSFILHYLAATADNKGGQRLAAALRNPPNDDYAMVIFGLALFLFVIALFMKDLHHLIHGISMLGRVSATVVALVGRISSDLLISLYGMGAFIIGWMTYDGYRHYRETMIPVSRVQVLGLGLYEFVGLVLTVGIASLIVRVDEEHPVVKAWYEAGFIWRLLAYLTFMLGLYFTFWANPADLFVQILSP